MAETPDSSPVNDELPDSTEHDELEDSAGEQPADDGSAEQAGAQDSAATGAEDPRRNFVWQLVAGLAGGIVAVGPVAVGLYTFLLNPFKRQRPPRNFDQGSAEGATSEYRIAPLAALPADGMPRRFAVIADKTDGWNFTPSQPIGAIYVARQPSVDGQPEQVVALHATCPHAGCTVSFDIDTDAFLCPCHNSSFAKDGAKKDLAGRTNPSPRALDELKVNQAKLDSDGEIWIEFVNYYTGRASMIAKR
jgi:nitrite reductase/ring-hydroxylating ferredoxin subunit